MSVSGLREKFALIAAFLLLCSTAAAQSYRDDAPDDPQIEKAEEIIARAVDELGGERYLSASSVVGKGRFSLLKDGRNASFQKFIDVIDYPDRERTDFDEGGFKTVQVNTGGTGWIFEERVESLNDQSERQIEGFKRSLMTHYDYLLRGNWKGEAELSYAGRRQASLGVRNDVIRLDFGDGFAVEYEFSDDGMPMKTVYTLMNDDKVPVTEETRYAQYVKIGGILTPFVVDRFTNDVHVFRVNYESVEYNKQIPEEIFVKPDEMKKLKKKLKI